MNAIVDAPFLRGKMIAFVIGVIGLVSALIGWITTPREFFVAYLFSEFFFLGLSLGSLGILMIHHLTAGYWGYGVRRFLEAAVGNLTVLALLFVSIFLCLRGMYHWKHPYCGVVPEIFAK